MTMPLSSLVACNSYKPSLHGSECDAIRQQRSARKIRLCPRNGIRRACRQITYSVVSGGFHGRITPDRRSATVQYEAQQLGYVCTWVAPEDELERIERENNDMLKRLLRQQERAEQLRAKTQLRVAK